MKSLIAMVVVIALATKLRAFDGTETYGFQSGMNQEQARAIIAKGGYEKVLSRDDSNIIFVKRHSGEFVALSFLGSEDNKLGIFQRSMHVSFSKFVAAIKVFQEKYGRAYLTYGATADPLNEYTKDTIHMLWNTPSDQIHIEFDGEKVTIRYYDRKLAAAFVQR